LPALPSQWGRIIGIFEWWSTFISRLFKRIWF